MDNSNSKQKKNCNKVVTESKVTVEKLSSSKIQTSTYVQLTSLAESSISDNNTISKSNQQQQSTSNGSQTAQTSSRSNSPQSTLISSDSQIIISSSDPSQSTTNQKQKTKYINEPCDPNNIIKQYRSCIEDRMKESNSPIPINEKDKYVLNGKEYFWVNKKECDEWTGSRPLSDYPIFFDESKAIVYRRVYVGELKKQVRKYKIKYLKPPTPPAIPPIIIRQRPDVPATPPPPLILRDMSTDLEEEFIREKPPLLEKIEEKVIHIEGRKLSPTPRRVIIEKIKPTEKVINVEKWQPYKRDVILEDKPLTPCIEQESDEVITWENNGNIEETHECLGEELVDPTYYSQKYGSTLLSTNELPKAVLNKCGDDESKPVKNVLTKESSEKFKRFYRGLNQDQKKLIDEIFTNIHELLE